MKSLVGKNCCGTLIILKLQEIILVKGLSWTNCNEITTLKHFVLGAFQ